MSSYQGPERRRWQPLSLPISSARFLLMAMTPTLLLMGAMLAVREVWLGPVTLPGGALFFPWTWACLTTATEVYGLRAGIRMASNASICLFAATVMYTITENLPVAPSPQARAAAHSFDRLYGTSPRALVGTNIGFAVATMLALMLLYVVATAMDGKLLVFRIWLAPTASQIITVMVAIPITFGLSPGVAGLLLTRVVYGVVMGTVMVPFILCATWAARRWDYPRPLPTTPEEEERCQPPTPA